MSTQPSLALPTQTDDFIAEIERFSAFGERTICETANGIDYFVNEFWTARQRQAHRLHEISYRACFKPQLPAFFIDRLTEPGDTVYDPFMGRGTTPLEAALRGRIPFGNDTNPLSQALVEARLDAPTLSEVREKLATIPWEQFENFEHEELLVFYHPKTLAEIEGLRRWLLERQASGKLDQSDKWIRMVAINRLTGHSSGFFSVYSLPPNQAVTVDRQAKINEKRKQTPEYRDVSAIILKKSKVLLSQGKPEVRTHKLLVGQSDATPQIPDASVDLVVTSPPFLDIVNYESDNWLRCWFLGIDPKAVKIASLRKVEDWQAFIGRTLTELSRIVRIGGHVAFEVGEVRNGKVRLEEHVIAASEGTSLKSLGVMVNQQEFTKTSNCWGVSNNQSGTNSNRIVIFERV